MAQGFCPIHNCDMTGIGSLVFCPKCEEAGTSGDNNAVSSGDCYYTYYKSGAKELVLHPGKLICVNLGQAKRLRRATTESIYKIPRSQFREGMIENYYASGKTYKTVKGTLIGVAAEELKDE